MYKIGIIRGLMPRLTQAEFAGSFEKIIPLFITGEAGKEIIAYCRENNLLHRNLQLKSVYYFDPVTFLFRKPTHQSWVELASLENSCKDLAYLETYELYHFFSGQAADISKKLHIPLICEVWTSFSKHPAYFIPPYNLTVKKVINTASVFIARSKRAARALEELGIPAQKIKQIYHGVNIQRFKPLTNKRPDREIRIVYVGSMERFKGVDLLIDIWPVIVKKYPQSQLWLAGDGSLLPSLSKLPQVKVFGAVAHQKLPEIYNNADIFISPSQDRHIGPFLWWEEFFSYTLMEAQASGLPIIATKSGGIPEEIRNENWLIPQNDRNALLSAIIDAVENTKKRVLIGQNNRKRAEKYFDLFKQTKILEEVILSLH